MKLHTKAGIERLTELKQSLDIDKYMRGEI